MPYRIRRKKGGCYEVSSPRGIKARCATKENAMAQSRLLHMVDKGLEPTRRGKGRRKRWRKERSL